MDNEIKALWKYIRKLESLLLQSVKQKSSLQKQIKTKLKLYEYI